MMKTNFLKYLFISGFLLLMYSCRTSGPGIFGKKSPHEEYGQKLVKAGLHTSALGKKWFEMAEKSLAQPLMVSIPYKETGFFDAKEPLAVGLAFPAKRGEKIRISLSRNPDSAFLVFLDLWQSPEDVNDKVQFLESADSSSAPIEYVIKKDGNYQLRIQPELLKDGEYTVEILSGPSLAYPIKAAGTNHIKSFWGAARDAGARSHEGIDLFAARNTPVVASAPGIITRVNQNNLGGKVVWLRPSGKDYTLYYAHLDTQMVRDGQRVQTGDTLGLMGNTGNARTTAPHLHFGIYSNRGAIDPLPFIDPRINQPAPITAQINMVGKPGRINKETKLQFSYKTPSLPLFNLKANSPVKVLAATANYYKVLLPDGTSGFVAANLLNKLADPIRKMVIRTKQPLLNAPDSMAPRKSIIESGSTVSVLGEYNSFYLIRNGIAEGWIEKS